MNFFLSNYSAASVRLIGEIKSGLDKLDPVLAQLRVIRVVHGGRTRQVSGEKPLDTNFEEATTDITIELESIKKTDTDKFRDFVVALHGQISSINKKMLFDMLNRVTETTGNSFDASNKNIWDGILEMTRSIDFTFDEDGNHNYSLYLNPEILSKLEANPPSTEQQVAMTEIIRNKREEYYAQKRTRRLS